MQQRRAKAQEVLDASLSMSNPLQECEGYWVGVSWGSRELTHLTCRGNLELLCPFGWTAGDLNSDSVSQQTAAVAQWEGERLHAKMNLGAVGSA